MQRTPIFSQLGAYIVLFIKTISFCLLFCPAQPIMLFACVLFSIGMTGILFFRKGVFSFFQNKSREYVLWELVITLTLLQMFYLRWLPSGKITRIAQLLHLSSSTFLFIIEIIIGTFAFFYVDLIVGIMSKYQNKRENSKKLFAIFLVCCEEYFILQFSTISCTRMIALQWQNILVFLSNLGIIIGLNLIIYLFLNSWRASLCLTVIFFTVWGIANYYTILFHGSPLFLSELVNAGTAMAVIGNYRFDLSIVIVIIILISIILLAANVVAIDDCLFHYTRKHFYSTVGCIVLVSLLTTGFYFSSSSKIQRWMPWYLSVSNGGFLNCNIKELINRANPIIKPDGYSKESLDVLAHQNNASIIDYSTYNATNDLPDIILILNETFFDLNIYSSVKEDIDFLEAFNNIDGAVYGHAVVPDIGGGTNNTEFELLTSKSMYLLNGSAPFTYINEELESRSVVNYLNELGYITTGMHCGDGNNYSRNTGYPNLGFQNIFLGKDSFYYYSKNGNRPWLDSDNYRDLIKHYKENDGKPQFIYLLTYQNHGGYQQNSPEMDTVHSGLGTNKNVEEINEYLTSIKLSAEAFHMLTDYYKEYDRKVIICMVGDHAPSFISELPENNNSEIVNQSINMRMVPYVIWTNYDANTSEFYDYSSITDIVPMVLKAGNIPMSVFYRYILNLHEELPIRTSDGIYVNRNFEIGTYGDHSNYNDMLNTYYYMEYNSLLLSEEYMEDLFDSGF